MRAARLLPYALPLVAGLLIGAFWATRPLPVGLSPAEASPQPTETTVPSPEAFSRRFVATASAVAPAVVGVKVYVKDGWGGERVGGSGSGVIIASDGTVLTNHHVIKSAARIELQLADGRRLPATVRGSDPNTDVAVLKVRSDKPLPAAELGDSDAIQVGQWILAIGNPFGIGQTVTSGIISARGRSGVGISHAEDFLQTDAAINPGNSGGPMVDLNGKVVGINTAIISRSGGNQGIGLAVPINIARAIVRSLDKTGEIVRGFLGVRIVSIEFTEGPMAGRRAVQIKHVSEGSPAAQAGLQVGDIILRYQGKPVRNVQHLLGRIAAGGPGEAIKLDLLRDDRRQTLTVTLGRRPVGDR